MILRHSLLTDRRTRAVFASIPPTRRLVDVGPGIRPCPLPCEEHVLIEPCEEYAAHLDRWRPPDRRVVILRGTADLIEAQPRADTTLLMLDVIEHMDRAAGERARILAEEFDHAVIFTPLGWCEQGGENPDAWGLGGGEWQRHRSAWQPKDFDNWAVTVWPDWHATGAILAVR